MDNYIRKNILIKDYKYNKKEKNFYILLKPTDLLVRCANALSETEVNRFKVQFVIKAMDLTKVIVKDRGNIFYIPLTEEESLEVDDIIYESISEFLDEYYRY